MQKRLKRFSTKSDAVIKIAIETNDDLIEGYLLDISINSARIAIEADSALLSEKAKAHLFTSSGKYDLEDVNLKRAEDDRATISATIEAIEGPQKVRNYSIYSEDLRKKLSRRTNHEIS